MDREKLKTLALGITDLFNKHNATVIEGITAMALIAHGIQTWAENPAAFEAQYGAGEQRQGQVDPNAN